MAAFADDVLFARVREIQGCVLACLVDAAGGMILGSWQGQDDLPLPVAAAGAADVMNAVLMMTGALASDADVGDVIITVDSHYHLIRLLSRGPGRQFLLLVTLDRSRARLGMALREIREFSAGLFTGQAGGLDLLQLNR